MRKTLYTLFAVLGLCMFAGCGSSSKGDDASPLAKQLVGEWHLVSWNGAAPGVFDAYVSFASDKTFEIYQQIEQVGYQKYTGSYLIGNKMLSGKYSDNTPWGSSYEVSFDESGNTLTLVSDPSVGEVTGPHPGEKRLSVGDQILFNLSLWLRRGTVRVAGSGPSD